MREKKALHIILLSASILCVAFFLTLFSSVRCDPDDMLISMEESSASFWQVFIYKYNSYSFRPVYTLFSFLTIGYTSNTDLYKYSVFAFYFLLFTLFVFSVFKILKEVFFTTNRLQTICFSIFLVTGIYFFTTEKIEIFGWISASAIHLAPVVFLFLSAAILFKRVTKKTDYLFLIISSAFVSGGGQHIPASVIAVIMAVTVLLVLEKGKKREFFHRNRAFIYKTIFFTGSLILFFILFTTNPGIKVHYGLVQQDVSHTQNRLDFFEAIKMFCKPAKLIGALFLLVVWALFFKTTGAGKPQIKLKYFFAAFLACFCVAFFASAFAYSSLAVGRVWFVTDVSFFVLLCAAAIKYIRVQNEKIRLILVTLSLVTIALFDIQHIPALVQFSSGHDRIVRELRQQRSSPAVLKSFPYPDLTNQVRLSPDTNNAENQLFCRFYGIKAKVALKK